MNDKKCHWGGGNLNVQVENMKLHYDKQQTECAGGARVHVKYLQSTDIPANNYKIKCGKSHAFAKLTNCDADVLLQHKFLA
jgi:hypothetical protein